MTQLANEKNDTTTRNMFGALVSIPQTAHDLVAQAAARGKIPAAYDRLSWDRKGRASGSAMHHEIYDITPDGNRALVCLRRAEGSRYGVRTTGKEYVVLARHGRGVRVLDANKAVAAKAAKAAGGSLGVAVETALGKRKLAVRVRTGYKLLVRTDTGFVSAWDGSIWEIGKARIQAATEDHSGGFYYYATLDEAIEAAASDDVFGEACDHRRLAVVEIEASGRHYAHRANVGVKLCATRVKPIREIATIL